MQTKRRLGLTLAAICLLALAAYLWSQNALRFEEIRTEVSNQPFAEFFMDNPPSLVPLARYERATRGKDPVTPLYGPPMLKGSFVRDTWRDVEVIGINWRGESPAYLLRIIVWHRVILDVVGDRALAITYDPVCDSVAVYDAQRGEDQRFFGVSGLVLDGNMVLYDRGEMSLWPQILGRCTTGEEAGEELPLVPFVRTTWGDWIDTHPEAVVQSVETGHVESAVYMRAWPRLSQFSVAREDARLPEKDPVVGVRTPETVKAYPVSRLKELGLLNDAVGNLAVVLLTKSQLATTRVYQRGSHRFTLSGQRLRDERGHLWLWSEEALTDPETSERLARVPMETALWFAWASAFPETEVYGSK